LLRPKLRVDGVRGVGSLAPVPEGIEARIEVRHGVWESSRTLGQTLRVAIQLLIAVAVARIVLLSAWAIACLAGVIGISIPGIASLFS
jgi:hypothetical protein